LLQKGFNEKDLRTARCRSDALGTPSAAYCAEPKDVADAIQALARLSVEEQRKFVAQLPLKIQRSDPPGS